MADCYEDKKVFMIASSNGNYEFARGDPVLAEATVAYTDEFGKKCKLQNSCDEEEYWWVDMDKIHTSCHYKSDLGKTYSDGMADAWNILKKIYLNEEEGGFSRDEFDEIFGKDLRYRDIFKMDIVEVVNKISHWKERKSYRIGDIVSDCDDNEGVVTCIYYDILSILWASGDVGEKVISTVTKTGKHIDGVEELLDKISAN